MGTTIRFLGHAAIEIQTGGHCLLIDPFISGNKSTPVKVGELSPEYILVTHAHEDHLGDTVEIAGRCGATVICNAEIRDWLSPRGVKAHGMNIGGGHTFPFGYLKMTQALHSSTLEDGSSGGNPAGFLLTTTEGRKCYFAGDTGLFGDMRLIGEEGLDLAMIPVGDNYTMGPDDALRAIRLLQPKIVVPIHYDTFPVIAQQIEPWKARVTAETQSDVIVMKPGDQLEVL